MKRRFIFYTLSLLLLNVLSYGQQTKQAKTIYQLLKLTENGCELTATNKMAQAESETIMGIEFPTNEQPRSIEDIETFINKPLFNKVAQFPTKQYLKPLTLPNGNYFYIDQALYGLRTKKGDVLISPKFTYVEFEENQGFRGYQGNTCEYYDLDGKKLMDGNYYYISKTPINTFIVQTRSGHGVVNASKQIIIKPNFYNIKYLAGDGAFYYKIFSTPDESYFLSSNLKDTIWANIADHETATISKGFLISNFGIIINLKTKRNVICETNFYKQIVSDKYQLVSIHDYKTRKNYLIDFKGNIISTNAFSQITTFGDRNYAAAAISISEEDLPAIYSPEELWGIIDNKGNWIVKPSFKRLFSLDDNLLVATNEKNECALMLPTGATVTPFKYSQIRQVNDTLLLCAYETKETITSDILNVKDFSVVKSNLPYRSLYLSPLCDSTVYFAEVKGTECILTTSFERMIDKNYARFFYGPERKSIVASDFPANRSVSNLYDCDGKMKTFKIEDSVYHTFQKYYKLNESLEHILLTDGRGYFLLNNGVSIRNDSHWQNIEDANYNGFYVTMMYGGKFGIVNEEGETVIPPVFEYISPFDPAIGLAKYNYNEKQKGYLQQDGTLLFGTLYNQTEYLTRDLFKVTINDRSGVVNRKNEIIIPLTHSYIKLYNGLLSTSSGQYDFTGQLIK